MKEGFSLGVRVRNKWWRPGELPLCGVISDGEVVAGHYHVRWDDRGFSIPVHEDALELAIEATQDERREVANHIFRLVRERYDNMHPYMINNGRCEGFAMHLSEAHQQPGGRVSDFGEVGHPDIAHYFYVYKGVYFDAEEPYGVTDPLLLPLAARQLRKDDVYTWAQVSMDDPW